MEQMFVHFAMDRIKASPNLLGRFKMLDGPRFVEVYKHAYNPNFKPVVSNKFKERLSHNTYFWWSLGLDQGVHHLTHYLVIYFLVV